jgi:hypothetical protein
MNAMKQYALSALALIGLTIVPFGNASAQVTVTAANPPSAVQGTIALDVEVTGSGFNNSASVRFYVTGTADTGGITVKKVNVNSSKKLIATIDVADTAIVNNFDIEVALSNGRKGKGTTLFSVQQKQTGKPTPEPEPVQVPPPGSCSGAPGVFPAFAYQKDRTHIVERRRGGYRVYDGTDVYLANSTGSCSVLVAIDASVDSYRQIGNEARIAYAHGSEIRLLKFPVDNGNVVPTAPLIIHHGTDPYGIGGVELSADGNTLYFSDEFKTADEVWMDTLNLVDIASCGENCPLVNLLTLVNSGIGGLSINPANDRLYMSIHHRIPDIRTVSLLEKQNGVWSSSLRHVVSDQDAAYLTVNGFAGTALGQWDYDGTGAPKAVLAIHVERTSGDTIEIFDVANCGASGTQSCFVSGESSVVRIGIVGSPGSFTSMPAAGDPAPNLLVAEGNWRDANELISEVDLDSMTVTPMVEGLNPDSAD